MPARQYVQFLQSYWFNFLLSPLYIAADAGSVYEPHPKLSLEWDPEQLHPIEKNSSHARRTSSDPKGIDFPDGLPSVLADVSSYFSEPDGVPQSPQAQKKVIPGQEIWVYNGGAT